MSTGPHGKEDEIVGERSRKKCDLEIEIVSAFYRASLHLIAI